MKKLFLFLLILIPTPLIAQEIELTNSIERAGAITVIGNIIMLQVGNEIKAWNTNKGKSSLPVEEPNTQSHPFYLPLTDLEEGQQAEIAENYDMATIYYERCGLIGDADRTRRLAIEQAEKAQHYWLAAIYYEELGEQDRAKELFVKHAEKSLKEGNLYDASQAYLKANDRNKYEEVMALIREKNNIER